MSKSKKHQPQPDVEMTVDPRVVSKDIRKFADQISGVRTVKVKRLDVEGVYKFTTSGGKPDELIDLDGSYLYQRLRVVGVNEDKSPRLIEAGQLSFTAEFQDAQNMVIGPDGALKVKSTYAG